MNFATLINSTDARPLPSIGGGTLYEIGERWAVRFDLRDYATPFPNKLFALEPGAQVHGWLHDFVPLVGISRSFG
jgi:hypothetical protein